METEQEEPSSLTLFQELLSEWEEKLNVRQYDPTDMLHKLADIIEKETNIFFAADRDPFEERHPSRVENSSQLGALLKTLSKKDDLVETLTSKYTKENYFTRSGTDKSSTSLNIAALRVIISINTPGIEVSTLHDADGLVPQLYKWIEGPDETLRTYASGILALVMDVQEYATEPEVRDKNSRLVPLLLQRLRQLQTESEEKREAKKGERFRRPFALFSKSPLKRRRSREVADVAAAGEMNGVAHSEDQPPPVRRPHLAGQDVLTNGDNKHDPAAANGPNSLTNGELKPSDRNSLHPGWPAGFKSPPHQVNNGMSVDNSNSSWAEMELNVIGHFEIYPVNLQTQQIFILRLLTPLAEYQDFLPLAQGTNILALLKNIINVRESGDARLAFEGLRLLASLFCHKKYTLEWVYTGSLQLLMEMPRPSIAATGSALCIYYLSCDDDTMEKICGFSQPTLERLVKYCLWLLECSHFTGKQYAIMFFGHALTFKVILDIFDKQDGLRKLYNSLSTMKILLRENSDPYEPTDDEVMVRQSLKFKLLTLKQYVETHLALRCERELHAAMEKDGNPPERVRPVSKSYRQDQEHITENINTVLNLMHFRSRWEPIDQLIRYGGVGLLLNIIVLAYDWSHVGREEVVKYALDILAVCSILPRVQLSLCETNITQEKIKGLNIMMSCAEGEVVNDPVVQKAGLLALCHILCGPIVRPGCVKSHVVDKTPSKRRSSEDVINVVWDCFRANNGIMAMLQLIQTRTPATDADAIRALACQVLVGLARSATATQIMSKLAIFNNGVLTMLVREPVLPDNRAEHLKFQKYAHELLKKVASDPSHRKPYDNHEISLDMIHRASVVANTKIRFQNKQLYQLIHEHLVMSGLKKTADTLRKEADILPLSTISGGGGGGEGAAGTSNAAALAFTASDVISTDMVPPNALHHHQTGPSTPSNSARRLLLSPPPNRQQSNNTSISTSPVAHTPGSRNSSSSQLVNSRARPALNSASSQSDGTPTTSLNIRINRTPRNTSQIVSNNYAAINQSSKRTSMRTSTCRLGYPQPAAAAASSAGVVDDVGCRVTLTSIVSEYLSNKHALCPNPMTTCPEFDLFTPHRCPDQRSRRSAPLNIGARMSCKGIMPPYGGPDGAKLDRRLIYSRYRPVKWFRAGGEDRDSVLFTSCAFSGNGNFLLAGTSLGDLKMFNIQSGEEYTYQVHDSFVNHVQCSKDNRLVITCCNWRMPYSKLWTNGEYFDDKHQFNEEEYLEFSKLTQDKVIGTKSEGVATIYDINTGQLIRTLKPKLSNSYTENRATFDPSDELILCDGVLWDYRMQREIHKLDKLNQSLSGVFHPGGLEIISNSEVWDIRTFHLLRTIPQLDQCQVVFSSNGNILYGVPLEQENFEGETKYETVFKTFEASDYSSIATIETKKSVLGLCPSWDDLNIAVVEQGDMESSLHPIESVVRLYDVGRIRDLEEDEEEEDDDGDGGEEDYSDDDVGDINLLDDDLEAIFESDASRSNSEDESGDNAEEDDDNEDNEDNDEDNDEDDDNEENGDDQDSWEDIEVQEVSDLEEENNDD